MSKKINDEKLLEMFQAGKSGKECAEYFGVSPAAISKKLKRLQPSAPPESLTALTPKEQRFVLERARGKNQTEAALAAYECGSRQSAKVIGSNLMRRPEIELAITDLMAEVGLTKRYRLSKLKQHVDSRSADISLKALDQSWKLSGDYAPEKHMVATIDITAIQKQRAKIKEQLAILENMQRLQGAMDVLDEESEIFKEKMTEYQSLEAEYNRLNSEYIREFGKLGQA